MLSQMKMASWLADFSSVGRGGDEQNTFDIVPGTWVDSQQVDDDGDATMFGQAVPSPQNSKVRANIDQVDAF